MPRQARIDFPGALHHVTGRAIEKKSIFLQEQDKRAFVDRLQSLIEKCSMQCYAWAIMDNHFHLLLNTGQTTLAEFMSRLLTGYAIYYNKAHRRIGHLFQNRYKSILCDRDSYLLPLIRYIHLNPIRAGLITFDILAQYPWTGHAEIMNKSNKRKITNRNEVLGYFGNTEITALDGYVEYIRQGIGLKEDYCGGGLIRSAGGLQAVMSRKKDEREMYDERILGDGDFVESVHRILDREDTRKNALNDISDLLNKISKYFQVDSKELTSSRNKNVREGRSVAIYLANKYCGMTITEAGTLFGIKQAAASSALQRGKDICAKRRTEDTLFN